jgi:hypothetical protein
VPESDVFADIEAQMPDSGFMRPNPLYVQEITPEGDAFMKNPGFIIHPNPIHVSNTELLVELDTDLPVMKVMSVARFPKELARFAQLFDEPVETNAIVNKLLIKVIKIAVMRFPADSDHSLHTQVIIPFIDEIFVRLNTIDAKTVNRLSILYTECVSNGYLECATRILQNTLTMDNAICVEHSYLPTIAWQALVTSNKYPETDTIMVEYVVKHYLQLVPWESCDSTIFSVLTELLIQTKERFPELYQDFQDIITYDITEYRDSDDILLCYMTIYVSAKLESIIPVITSFVECPANYTNSTSEIVDMIVEDMTNTGEYDAAYNMLSIYLNMASKLTCNPPSMLDAAGQLYCENSSPEILQLVIKSLAIDLDNADEASAEATANTFVHFVHHHPDTECLLLAALKNKLVAATIRKSTNYKMSYILTQLIAYYTKTQEFPEQIWDMIGVIRGFPIRTKHTLIEMYTLLMVGCCKSPQNINYAIFKGWFMANWCEIVTDNDHFIECIANNACQGKPFLIESAPVMKRLLGKK